MTDVQAVHNRYAIAREKYLGNDFAVDYFFVNRSQPGGGSTVGTQYRMSTNRT